MMQQTEKYQLNLIETSDTFSPAPLNENMEKLEAAIAADNTALDLRIQLLEARRIVFGSYTGNAASGNDYTTKQTISLGFTPRFVLVTGGTTPFTACDGTFSQGVAIQEGGFTVHSGGNFYNNANNPNAKYTFLAIL